MSSILLERAAALMHRSRLGAVRTAEDMRYQPGRHQSTTRMKTIQLDQTDAAASVPGDAGPRLPAWKRGHWTSFSRLRD